MRKAHAPLLSAERYRSLLNWLAVIADIIISPMAEHLSHYYYLFHHIF